MRTRALAWWRKGYGWLRSQDLIVLLMMLGVVVGLWAFVELADEVTEGDTRAVDEWVIKSLRDPGNLDDPWGPVWFEEGIRDITALGGITVLCLMALAVVGYVAMCRQYHAMGLFLAAIIGGGILNVLLKNLFDRPRPELVPALSHVSTASFPSGHSMLSAVFYLTLGALLARLVTKRRLKLYLVSVALMFTFLVGFSRVYLGVHYPSDVLAGWTIGLIWAILCWLVARHLQRRGAVEEPNETTAESGETAEPR